MSSLISDLSSLSQPQALNVFALLGASEHGRTRLPALGLPLFLRLRWAIAQ